MFGVEKILNGQIRIRNAGQEDVPFIFNSWLRSYRFSRATEGIRNPVYFANHHKLLEGICKTSTIKIACNNQDISQIYGYIVYEKRGTTDICHFVYIKESYRKLGLAKVLAESVGLDIMKPFFYTHRTNFIAKKETKLPALFNPYLTYAALAAIEKEDLEKAQKEGLNEQAGT